jgi:hypothetical protein
MSEPQKDAVIRISKSNHKRLKELLSTGEGRFTINDLMQKLLDTMESVQDGQLIYLVNDRTFDDLAEARGEAIMRAVKSKEIPSWPKVAVVIGEDTGS